MSSLLLTTKLYIPPARPGLVPRSRLIERLDAGLRSKLTLISAPAGFGKTTLLAEWLSSPRRGPTDGRSIPTHSGLRHSQSPVPNPSAAWLSLDAGDNDPIRFLTYVVAALQTVDDTLGQSIPSLLQAPQQPSLESLIAILINEIAESPGPCLLVLDDYHVITALPIHDALAALLEGMPPQMHLVLAGRADPPFPLSRLRVGGDLTEIRADDLRFTPQETADLINQVMGLGLSAQQIADLDTRTEGWAAGLQLAALALRGTLSVRGRDDVASFIEAFGGNHRYVIDYLAEQVLQQQPTEVRDFLSQTAILDRLTAPLCNAVTGRSDGQAILARLEQNNLFLVPLDDRREWYRYHRLFADFLRTQTSPEQQAAWHQRAAHWYETQGFIAQAIDHALAAGAVTEAGRLIGLASETAIQNGEFTTLRGWLDALPDSVVRADHALAGAKAAVSLLTGQLDVTESYLAAADTALPVSASPSDRGRLVYTHACLALARGDIASTIALATEVLDLVGDTDPFRRRSTWFILAEAQWFAGEAGAAILNYRHAARAFLEGREAHLLAATAAGNLALVLNQQGQRREAVALSQDALAQCIDPRGKPLPIAGIPHITLGVMCYEANDLAQARQHLRDGVSLARQCAVNRIFTTGAIFLSWVQQALGEFEAALETIREARQRSAPSALFVYDALLAAAEADLHLRQGNIAAVERWAEAAYMAPTDTPFHVLEPAYILYARLLLVQNRPHDAQTLLATLAGSAEEGERRRNLIYIRILQALAQETLGHREQALDHLEAALHLAAPEGYVRAFLDGGQPVAALLGRVRHAAPTFVDDLLESFGARAQEGDPYPMPLHTPTRSDAPSLVEPLTAREIQVLRLIAAGRSNKEIAAELVVALSTVKKHINHIYGKLGVKSRTQALLRAQEIELL